MTNFDRVSKKEDNMHTEKNNNNNDSVTSLSIIKRNMMKMV